MRRHLPDMAGRLVSAAADAGRPAIFGRCSALERSDGAALQALAQRVDPLGSVRASAVLIDTAQRVVCQAAK